eukprot:1755623-Rhodomonas_salina.1
MYYAQLCAGRMSPRASALMGGVPDAAAGAGYSTLVFSPEVLNKSSMTGSVKQYQRESSVRWCFVCAALLCFQSQ